MIALSDGPQGEQYQFVCSGRTFYANRYIIGISPDLTISEGFDGGIREELTTEEQGELADFMIDLWGQYKAHVHDTLDKSRQ